MTEFKLIKTSTECCANCKGEGKECDEGFAWVYCEARADNDDEFNGDCGELLGCNKFVRKMRRVRVYPTDTDETFEGTIINEKPNYYVVIPDDNLQLTQNWNKTRCNIIG